MDQGCEAAALVVPLDPELAAEVTELPELTAGGTEGPAADAEVVALATLTELPAGDAEHPAAAHPDPPAPAATVEVAAAAAAVEVAAAIEAAVAGIAELLGLADAEDRQLRRLELRVLLEGLRVDRRRDCD